ncbi:hypothetical protein Nepgr_015766 [Nepenthes gracilis]|uniref:Uncharacterized protein n=1 Tax=Nepenthes gracilis TaxID=150966 RepID=A0AAD3SLH8_NEPGR|nr:hypothetical protein Nepgr_015766 [Nepenthes gracilis]
MGIEDLIDTNDSPSQSVPHVTTPAVSWTSKERKRKASVNVKILSDCIIQTVDILSTNINKVSEILKRSLEVDRHEQRIEQLYAILAEIHDLSVSERNTMYMKCILDLRLIMSLFNHLLG